MTTFKSIYFMPQGHRTRVLLEGFNGSMNKLVSALSTAGLNLEDSSTLLDLNNASITGFSDEEKECQEQLEQTLGLLGVPDYIKEGYQFFDDRVWLESIEFNGVSILLTNFLSSGPKRPKWAQSKFVGEIVNYGNEIYAIKLPKIKRDEPLKYRIADGEYRSCGTYLNHTFSFEDGVFLQIIEFPPFFLLKGYVYAVDFFESLLKVNGFELTENSENCFPGANQIKAFYL